MVDKLLKSAGLLAWESLCPDPPSSTYAIYFDEVTTDGPDGYNWILTHDCTVELYEPTVDAAAEAAVEKVLDDSGISWTKQSRYWLQSVQRYQVIYEFTIIDKRRP